MLAASRGSRLRVTVTGDDEAAAMAEIERLFANAFDEGMEST